MGGYPEGVAAGVELYAEGLRGSADLYVDVVDVVLAVAESDGGLVVGADGGALGGGFGRGVAVAGDADGVWVGELDEQNK